MIIESKFTRKGYIFPVVLLTLPVLYTLAYWSKPDALLYRGPIYAILFLVLLIDVGNRTVKVWVSDTELIVSKYWGLASKKHYALSDLDDLKPAKENNQELVCVTIKGKRVCKLSQFYLSNFTELKQLLAGVAAKQPMEAR